MSFRILGLDPAPFASLARLDDAALAAQGMRRYRADEVPGFPCRVSLDDAALGEPVILLNWEHLPEATPYRARHAIFVREQARERYDRVDAVPPALARRTLSLRAFDRDGWMLDADLVEGRDLPGLIGRFLADPRVDFLQAHYAKRGCFAARVERAGDGQDPNSSIAMQGN